MYSGGRIDKTGVPAGTHSPGPEVGIVDQPAGRRRLLLLRESPIRLFEGRAAAPPPRAAQPRGPAARCRMPPERSRAFPGDSSPV